jgi:hypothetical protein
MVDGLAKTLIFLFSVIPAEAGIQLSQGVLDPGVRRGDGLKDFLRARHGWLGPKKKAHNTGVRPHMRLP